MGDDGLKAFEKELMSGNPAHRPSLADWSAERLDTTSCDDEDTDYVDERAETRTRKLRPRMTLESTKREISGECQYHL
jgi:hypothetical protein